MARVYPIFSSRGSDSRYSRAPHNPVSVPKVWEKSACKVFCASLLTGLWATKSFAGSKRSFEEAFPNEGRVDSPAHYSLSGTSNAQHISDTEQYIGDITGSNLKIHDNYYQPDSINYGNIRPFFPESDHLREVKRDLESVKNRTDFMVKLAKHLSYSILEEDKEVLRWIVYKDYINKAFSDGRKDCFSSFSPRNQIINAMDLAGRKGNLEIIHFLIAGMDNMHPENKACLIQGIFEGALYFNNKEVIAFLIKNYSDALGEKRLNYVIRRTIVTGKHEVLRLMIELGVTIRAEDVESGLIDITTPGDNFINTLNFILNTESLRPNQESLIYIYIGLYAMMNVQIMTMMAFVNQWISLGR